MARGFVIGMLWGTFAAGAGLVVVSQLAPLQPTGQPAEITQTDASATVTVDPEAALADQAALDKAAAERAASEKAAVEAEAAKKMEADRLLAEKVAADQVAAEKAASERAAAEKAAADQLAADKLVADATAAAKSEADQLAAQKNVAADEAAAADKAARDKVETDQAAQSASNTPTVQTDVPQVTASLEPSALPEVPADSAAQPSLSGLDQALAVPPPEQTPPIAPAFMPPVPEGPKDSLLVPGQPVGQEPSRLPQIAPVVDPEIGVVIPGSVEVPQPDQNPKTSPASTITSAQPTLPPTKPLEDKVPTTVLDKTVPGVTANALPQVGVAAETVTEVPQETAPVRRYAREFSDTSGKPLFVILLHDVGSAGMSRDELVKLPFPVSFVVDPLATDARAASAAYRAAGQEVVTLANGIPQGATAADLETTFQTLSDILPESVAVMDQDIGGFQDARPLAALVLEVIKGEERGLVTFDRGLNAADQIARREGVPSAVIYRRLDIDGESKPTIRRYLDRAAFRAAQTGAVVVLGDTRADTVAAILEWTIEGRAATVTLAPVTAVLGK